MIDGAKVLFFRDSNYKSMQFILYSLRFAVTLNKLRCISTIKIKKSLF